MAMGVGLLGAQGRTLLLAKALVRLLDTVTTTAAVAVKVREKLGAQL